MVVRVRVEIEGYREMVRKLNSEHLLAGPWTDAMGRVADLAEGAWQGAMPVASGQAKAKIATKVQARPIPKWVRIKTTATRSSRKYKRYRYPGRQEYDPRSRNRQKLTRALQGVMGRIDGVLTTAARKIEAKWRS